MALAGTRSGCVADRPVGSHESRRPDPHQRQLAAALRDHARPPGLGEGAVERLLLAFEELVSNGLRHGAGPVRAAVTAHGSYRLLGVSDAAPDRPPTPAVDRDPAQGGLGLHLVARICGAHGWFSDAGRKVTWARADQPAPRRRTTCGRPPLVRGEHFDRCHDR
jgi:anti-sigma regulatory factor (Ser/Thr protein kinase)